jgi:hypothetical protein
MEMEGAGEKQSIIRTFEDLDVWKVCRDLRTQIATISEHISKGGAISATGSAYQVITICYGQSSRGIRAISLRGEHPVCEIGKGLVI